MGILETRDLSLRLGDKDVLNKVNIDLWQGHIHAIVGPNGAGKSTFAMAVMGLSGYRDVGGDIIFDGRSIKDLGIDERSRMGITLAWQEPARYEGLRVRDFLTAPARDRSDDNIHGALEQAGLEPEEYLDRAVDDTLSGGERKKVELASILVIKPRLVLLDEPDSGIDVESLERIFESLRVLKDQGTTTVLITHSLAVLEHAEHAFLMCDGQIVDKGKMERIRSYFEEKCVPCDHKNLPDRAMVEGGD